MVHLFHDVSQTVLISNLPSWLQEVITKDYTRQSQQQQQSYHGSPVLDLTRPPSASQPPPTSQESAQGVRYQEGLGGERNRERLDSLSSMISLRQPKY